MIVNARKLTPEKQTDIARKISALSHRNGSSLLPRSIKDITTELQSGTTYAKIAKNDVIFTVAFEPTGYRKYFEIGMVCNLNIENVRGKNIFPEVIAQYRRDNGNGTHLLYLTTNNIRMATVAKASGFEDVQNIYTKFPKEIIAFCCNPCQPNKTGVKKIGDQINYCPRFFGEFIPDCCTNETHFPCMILAQHIP